MASRISRKVCTLGRPGALGTGRWGSMQDHSSSERSVGYVFLMCARVANHHRTTPFRTVSEGVFSETNYTSRLGTPPFAPTVSVVATAHHASLPNTSRTPTQCPGGCAAAHSPSGRGYLAGHLPPHPSNQTPPGGGERTPTPANALTASRKLPC